MSGKLEVLRCIDGKSLTDSRKIVYLHRTIFAVERVERIPKVVILPRYSLPVPPDRGHDLVANRPCRGDEWHEGALAIRYCSRRNGGVFGLVNHRHWIDTKRCGDG